jgi:septum formation protein
MAVGIEDGRVTSMKIILGSQSEGRQKVLREAGVAFTIMPANIDEKAIRSDDYELLPLLVARAKTEALLALIHEPVLLITADTVAIFNGELREKPETAEEASRFLKSYIDNEPVRTSTGVVVTNTLTGKRFECTDGAAAYFRPIPDDVVAQLVRTERPFSWAGGFATDEPLLRPFLERVEGEAQSIYGLPLQKTLQLMQQALEA